MPGWKPGWTADGTSWELDGLVDMLAPVIRLEPLTHEELLVLVEKLADIHAEKRLIQR